MMISATMTTGLGILFIAGAGLLLIGGRDSDRKLRARIAAAREVQSATTEIGQGVLLGPTERKSLPIRAAEWLGYRSDLPAPYAVSLRIVGIISFATGFGAFRLLGSLLAPVFTIPIAIAIALFTASLLFHRKGKAYRTILFRQIPDAMSLMLRAVRAGLPIAEAIRSVSRESMSPTREEFARVAGEAALGMPIEVTLNRLYVRTGIQEYAFFSVVIGLHGQTGGNLSETLENLADMVRRRVAMAGKAKALAAEGRLSAAVVGALPFVVGVLLAFVNPEYMGEFTRNPGGPMLIATFAILLTLGMATTHWLIQRSTQD